MATGDAGHARGEGGFPGSDCLASNGSGSARVALGVVGVVGERPQVRRVACRLSSARRPRALQGEQSKQRAGLGRGQPQRRAGRWPGPGATLRPWFVASGTAQP